MERAIFEALEAAYKTPEGTSNKDMGLVALNAFTTDLFAR